MKMKLQSKGPSNFNFTTKIISDNHPQVFEYVDNNGYRRVFRIANQLFLTEAEMLEGDQGTQISVRYLNSKHKVNNSVLKKIRWILSLDVDLTPFYLLMEKNVVMQGIKNRLFGLKLLRSASPYEALIEAVIEQQISKKASMTLRLKLASKYSEFVPYEGKQYFEFPRSEVLASSNYDDLTTLGFSKNKISAIIAISELESQGKLDDLLRTPLTHIYSELSKIKGIGNWTIQYTLIRGLGRYDIQLQNDTALTRGMDSLFGEDYFAKQEDRFSFLEQYNIYVGYASFYIIFANVFSRNQDTH